MLWYKRTFTNEERNQSKYHNAMREIQSHFDRHPEKQKHFAVFKDMSDKENHTLYFSPTEVTNFMILVYNELNSEPCEKPDIENISLHLGYDEYVF